MEDSARVRDDNLIIPAARNLLQYSSTWVLLLAGVVTILAVVSNASRKTKTAGLPPGPRNWPVIGALLELESLLHKTFDKFAKKYGPVVFFRLGVQSIAVVSSAEAAKELLKYRDAEFSNRVSAITRTAAKYMGLDGRVLLFLNYGADLKLQRKILMTENLTVAKIKSFENLRTQEMVMMVEKIISAIRGDSSSNDSKEQNTSSLAIRLIARAVTQNMFYWQCFGKRYESLASTDFERGFIDLLAERQDIARRPNVVDVFPWLRWLDPHGSIKRLKSFGERHTLWLKTALERAKQEIKDKRESGVWNDSDSRTVLQTLILAQEGGSNIDDNGIMALLDAFLAAGVNTTSSQTEWTLLELVRHPKVLQRLQHEIDSVVGKDRLLEESDLQAMPFLNAVFQESLRLHGVGAFSFPHVNLRPSNLCGYDIPANTAVFLNIYSIGRDPKVWKDPLEFNPERFMAGGSNANSTPIHASGSCYDFVPFGSGRRICAGHDLAKIIVSRTVATLVHAFDWSTLPGCSPEDLSVDEMGPIILQPTLDLYLIPTPRLSPQAYKSNLI